MKIHTRKTLTDDCEVVKVDELIELIGFRGNMLHSYVLEGKKELHFSTALYDIQVVVSALPKAKTDSESENEIT